MKFQMTEGGRKIRQENDEQHSGRNKGFTLLEKLWRLVTGTVISFLLGFPVYALGVVLAASIAWFLYRWQMTALANTEGLSPRKATNRLIARSMIKLIVFLCMAGLSYLGGKTFLFGVLTGLLLQVMAYIGQAVLLYEGARK